MSRFPKYAYQWEAPVARRGDGVTFTPHRGREKSGEIVSVVTHYTRLGQAYHIYEILVRGEKLRHHVDVGAINFVSPTERTRG